MKIEFCFWSRYRMGLFVLTPTISVMYTKNVHTIIDFSLFFWAIGINITKK